MTKEMHDILEAIRIVDNSLFRLKGLWESEESLEKKDNLFACINNCLDARCRHMVFRNAQIVIERTNGI